MRTSRIALALATLIGSGCGVSLLGTEDEPPPASADGGEEGGGTEAGSDVVSEADVSTDAPAPDTGCVEPTTPGCACGVLCASKTCSNGGCDPLVFVGTTVFRATFGDTGAAAVAAADAACETLAGGLQRTPKPPFRAWFSANGAEVKTRFQKSSRPYRLNDAMRSIVANDFPSLGGELAHAINVTENGSNVDDRVWTGTTRDGAWSGNDCGGWSGGIPLPNASASVGRTSYTTVSWSRDTEEPCSGMFHLYCFEQLP